MPNVIAPFYVLPSITAERYTRAQQNVVPRTHPCPFEFFDVALKDARLDTFRSTVHMFVHMREGYFKLRFCSFFYEWVPMLDVTVLFSLFTGEVSLHNLDNLLAAEKTTVTPDR